MNADLLLSAKAKKGLKILHVITVAGVLGGLLAILTLLLVRQGLPDKINPFPMDYAMMKLFMYLITFSSFGLITTSVLYELFTEWGLLKFYWMMAKWGIAIMVFVVSWTGLGPSINGMASISDAGFNATTMKDAYKLFEQKALVFVCINILLMLAAGILSVVKPWGKRQEKKPVNRKKILIWLVPILLIALSMPIMQGVRLQSMRNLEIEDSNLAGLEDGVYYGEAEVGNYVYKVNVEIKSHQIVKIESVDPRKSPYVAYAEGVFGKIIGDQNADTDAITGATTTSKAYMKAVENAIKLKNKD